jgi:hypothetical protein
MRRCLRKGTNPHLSSAQVEVSSGLRRAVPVTGRGRQRRLLDHRKLLPVAGPVEVGRHRPGKQPRIPAELGIGRSLVDDGEQYLALGPEPLHRLLPVSEPFWPRLGCNGIGSG